MFASGTRDGSRGYVGSANSREGAARPGFKSFKTLRLRCGLTRQALRLRLSVESGKTRMNSKNKLYAVIYIVAVCLLPVWLCAQSPAVPTMDHEPHHHLALHNDYVKVFNVEVAPGDSIILHSHDQDTIAIAIGDQLVTVGIPGKTSSPSKNADGQVRLQRGGYIH